MSYELLVLERRDNVGVIKLNRPEVLNALSRQLYREIDTAVSELEADDGVRAVIFSGAGDRAFSAGADIHEMVRNVESNYLPTPEPGHKNYSWHIATCIKPTIGALNGLAYGGGAVMASSFDIRVGCERTKFRFLAAQYGRVNSTWTLPMQVGWPVAKDLLLTARVVEADEAYRIGLLNYLVPYEELMDKAMEVALQIADNDPRMVQGIKELMIEDVGDDWRQMHDNEVEAIAGKLAATPVLEGFKSFLDRKGRK
ncbi:enoyl-CoA hydratase/isomerase family protein [Dehalococcoidia bacterium]|nr:enoyl-CoA hydratase/isomerase family protein [Dehalococcoidia bacterium]